MFFYSTNVSGYESLKLHKKLMIKFSLFIHWYLMLLMIIITIIILGLFSITFMLNLFNIKEYQLVFFVLIPCYWLTSIMLYASSPKQQIKPRNQQALLTRSSAWISFFVLNTISFVWLTVNNWSTISVSIYLLLLNMLMMPCSIMLLAHKPNWLKAGTVVIFSVCVMAQFVVQEY